MLTILHLIGIGSLVSYVFLLVTLKPDNNVLLLINLAMLGVFNVPITPIGFYAAAELTAPVSEVLSSGLIMTFGMLFGVIMTYAISLVCDDKSSSAQSVKLFLLITVGMLLVACISLFKVEPARGEAERQRQSTASGRSETGTYE